MTNFRTLPQYGVAIRRKHKPPRTEAKVSKNAVYRDCLRREFSFTCVYCLSHEVEVSRVAPFGGFEVEHFKPEKHFPKLVASYINLLWACRACNSRKWYTWPNKQELALGFRFLNPTEDALRDHLQIQGATVAPLNGSLAAQYTIDEVQLNSEYHQHVRRERAKLVRRLAQLDALLASIEKRAANHADPATKKTLLHEATTIRDEIATLVDHKTWDAPQRCACPQ